MKSSKNHNLQNLEFITCKKNCSYNLQVTQGRLQVKKNFHETICDRLTAQGLIRSKWDPCVFLKYSKPQVRQESSPDPAAPPKLLGIAVVHVDDIVFTGCSAFTAVVKHILEKCNVKDLKSVSPDNPVTYCGLLVKKTTDGYSIDQDKYVEMIDAPKYNGRRLEEKLTEKDIETCRSVLGQLAWVANQTRPEIACFVSETVGRLAEDPRVRVLKNIAGIVEYLKQTKGKSRIMYRPLGDPSEELALAFWCDASWASMPGLRSQEGYVTVLVTKKTADIIQSGAPLKELREAKFNLFEFPAAILSYRSGRIRRVVRSTFAAEVMALSSAMDDARALSGVVQELYTGKASREDGVSVVALVDAFAVVSNVNSSCPNMTEKRLMLDCIALWEQIQQERLCVRWIPTEYQYADPLTKNLLTHRFTKSMFTGLFSVPQYK